MNNYSITFKIKDYEPKTKLISYNNFLCLLMCGDFQLSIPITDDEYQISKHFLKSIKSDIYYKITLFENKRKILIGYTDFIIPYKTLYKTNPNSENFYEKTIKFILSEKLKKKLYGASASSLIDNNYICINIVAKIVKKQKTIKYDNKLDNIMQKHITRGANTSQTSFTQKTQGNIVKINKNRIIKDINKDKDEIFSSDSNRLISTNDLSGNYFNTNSINDDNENNMNSILNSISNIINVISNKYHCLNTSIEKKEKENKKENKINEYKNKEKDTKIKHKPKNIEIKELYVKDKKINDILNFSNELLNNSNRIKIQKTKNFSQDRFITRNSFISYSNNNTKANDSNSLKKFKRKIKKIKLRNEDIILRSCSGYSNKHCMSPEIRKIKNTPKTNTLSSNNIINGYKYISLNKGTLKKKKKTLSQNIFHKVLLTDRLSMSQSINNKYKTLNSDKNKNNKSYKNKRNTIFNQTLKTCSKININKNETIKSPTNKKIIYINFNGRNKNKIKDNNSTNNIHIIVNRKNKKKDLFNNSNIKNVNNHNNKEYEYKQTEFKNNIIKLLHYFILNDKNIKLTNIKLKENRLKLTHIKESFLSLLKISNKIEDKNINLLIDHFLLNNEKNNEIRTSLIKIKQKEINIFQKIFNFLVPGTSYIRRNTSSEHILNHKILMLQLSIIKNLVDHYGNISQIFHDDINKKEKLKNILCKYNILEKENKNKFIDLVSLNKINNNVKKIIKNTFNNDVNYEFNIIKEVQEEKESEKHSNNNINNNSSFNNEISDELFFIDRKESFYEEDDNSNVRFKLMKNSRSDFNNKNYTNLNQIKDFNRIKNQNIYKRNLRNEIIGMNKRQFKGKNLNFDEYDFDYKNESKNKIGEHFIKIGFFK